MGSKRSIGNNTSGPDQPPSYEVKVSFSDKPMEFPTFDPSRRYSPYILSQSTLTQLIPLHPELLIEI